MNKSEDEGETELDAETTSFWIFPDGIYYGDNIETAIKVPPQPTTDFFGFFDVDHILKDKETNNE